MMPAVADTGTPPPPSPSSRLYFPREPADLPHSLQTTVQSIGVTQVVNGEMPGPRAITVNSIVAANYHM